MQSTVRSRPTHYELLGLSPAAKPDEIVEAFSRALSLPRAFGSLADVTIAYETLRDTSKRKAYDSSIGLQPEPKPALSLTGRLEGAQFLGARMASPVERLNASPKPALRVTPPSRIEARPQPRTAPSATALLHQPITPTRAEAYTAPKSTPTPMPNPEELRRPTPADRPRPEPETSGALSRIVAERAHGTRQSSLNWKLPAIAAGALFLAVGAGAWTGWEAGNDTGSVTVKVPSAKPLPAASQPAFAIAPSVSATPADARKPRLGATSRRVQTRPPLQITLPEAQEAEVTLLEQKQRELEIEQASAESPAVAAAARMPLPNAVIARTIGRIGYPCRQVASTSAVGGAPGVFNVTCTSGHSYRASPVRGRYHFRRLGSG